MRHLCVFLILLGSTAAAQDLAAIEQLHQKDVAAAKAGDTATLATLWTDDAVVLPPGEQPVVVSMRFESG
jgi:ketosteroid isomerase-like protein